MAITNNKYSLSSPLAIVNIEKKTQKSPILIFLKQCYFSFDFIGNYNWNTFRRGCHRCNRTPNAKVLFVRQYR